MIKELLNRYNRKGIYIAEIGLNHNGEFAMAKKMIDSAKAAGADAVKFQTFMPENMNSQFTTALLQRGFEEFKDSSQFDFFSRFCFSEGQYRELKDYSDSKGIIFFSTPFDVQSVDLLENIEVPILKVASSEVTNHFLLIRIAKTGKPVFISTGISTEKEISMAVDILRSHGTKEIVLMHCVSLYPVEYNSINLKKIAALKEKFNLEVGFSDHTKGTGAAILASAMGARIFEKHFTIDKAYDCPDREVSVDGEEFRELIISVEKSITMLGNGEISYSRDEAETARSARRSLFAKRFIPRGKIIDRDDMTALRPGIGIPVYEIDTLVGLKSRVDIKEGFIIKREDIE